MTQPRSQQVSLLDTPYYHCVSRCVRRAFLCGNDERTGVCYEHRRQWIVDRMRLLSSIFTLDICAYAVMNNHYHLVVKIDSSKQFSNQEVIQRWLTLYKGPLLVQRFAQGETLDQAECKTVDDIVTVWRNRLQDLSWFMKCLNEPIARMANQEDNCTGHFWESRFKCQPLLSEEALLSCMAYVDLNPVRAGMADTPEDSEFTSVQERIKPKFDAEAAIRLQQDNQYLNEFNLALKPLLHFDKTIKNETQNGIPFPFSDYLKLVDWTGRAIRNDKRGHIPSNLPPILQRLNIPIDRWLVNSQHFEKIVYRQFRKIA